MKKHKISVISRGQALGYTISLPTEDKFLTTRAELSDTMAMTLGGRIARDKLCCHDFRRCLLDDCLIWCKGTN
jgi:ATP-dependent Zn protease